MPQVVAMKELISSLDTVTDTTNAESWQIPHLPLVKTPRFGLHARLTLDNTPDAERLALEHYIYQRFLQAHNARVTHFLPLIVGLRCRNVYSAAVGLAPAVLGNLPQSLFAERYLPQPIEMAIANRLGGDVDRSRIVEIGNLVSSWKGSSLLLFIFLSELIERLGYHWVLFTATREVETLLKRLQYAPVILADANPDVLPDAGESWGSYYQRQPRVMFGDVCSAVNSARKNSLYRTVVAVMDSQINTMCAHYQALLKGVTPLASADSLAGVVHE